MYKIGDAVRIIHDGSIGAIIGLEAVGGTTQYRVLVNGKIAAFFEGQISPCNTEGLGKVYTAKEVNALLTSRLIINPSISSLKWQFHLFIRRIILTWSEI